MRTLLLSFLCLSFLALSAQDVTVSQLPTIANEEVAHITVTINSYSTETYTSFKNGYANVQWSYDDGHEIRFIEDYDMVALQARDIIGQDIMGNNIFSRWYRVKAIDFPTDSERQHCYNLGRYY